MGRVLRCGNTVADPYYNQSMRFYWIAIPIVLVSVLTVVFVAKKPADLHGTAIEAAPRVPDTVLSGSDGRPHTLRSWKRKVTLAFFAYTHCPDTCPLTLAALARSYESLGSPKDLQVVMITVDPSRDSPERLKHYLAKFNSSFIGLTGTAAQIAQVSTAFYVGYRGENESIEHTDAIMVIDRSSKFVLVYNQDDLTRQILHKDLPGILRLK